MKPAAANPFLTLADGQVIDLPAPDRGRASRHVFERRAVLAINAALAARRPLLLRGKPGVGKSQLARAAAAALDRAFVSKVIDARTEPGDLLWTYDAVARLARAQLLAAESRLLGERSGGAVGVAEALADLRKELAEENFVTPGPLWWAFAWSSASAQADRVEKMVGSVRRPDPPPEGWGRPDRGERSGGEEPNLGTVLLIDEIDKADSAVPSSLLEALGDGKFSAPGHKEPIQPPGGDRGWPLVMITTNEERVLPDAFLRRCLVLHLDLPKEEEAFVRWLVARGRAHFLATECDDEMLVHAARTVWKDRVKAGDGLMPPGLAEYLDLLAAVIAQRSTMKERRDLLDHIAGYVLQKHPPEP